jgi:LytTr DNA-binding domain
MIKFLNKPYPFNDDLKHNAKIILFISLGVLVFLLIFQPIKIDSFSTRDIFYLFTGLAISTFLILCVNLLILPSLFPKLFYNNIWNIKREIIWNLWIMFSISTSNLLFYTKLFGLFDIGFSDIGRILLLGFLPVSALIVINQDRLFRSHLKSAQELNKKLMDSKIKKEKLVHFESDYKKDKLSILPSSLILIKSADNYIEIYFESEGGIKNQMIRSSLKRAGETIKEFDFIIRCHRTYIVNTNHIKEIEGNSQGYKLYFERLGFTAQVSQKYINSFKETI